MKTTTSLCLVILMTLTSLASSCKAFRFPDPESEIFSRHPKLQNKYSYTNDTTELNLVEDVEEVGVKPFCNGTDYCNYATNYPSKLILKTMAKTRHLFASMFDAPIIGIHISARANFDEMKDEEEENVCGMFHEDITPRVAKNTQGKFKFVVNSPENSQKYIQRVQTGQCYSPGDECFSGGFSASTYCKQQFLEHKLLAMSDDMTTVVVDTFNFPSCCTCHVKTSEL